MPIRLKCKCGKTLALKDELAGKTVRCPGCKAAIKVPAAGGSTAKSRPAAAKKQPAPKPAPKPASQPPAKPSVPQQPVGVSSLFDEEGISEMEGPVCPSCAKEMKPGTFVCMNCGYNVQSGTRLQAHTEALAAASEFNNKELDQAAEHMARDKKVQKQVMGDGMPLWALSTWLLCLIGLSVVGVFVSNAFLGDGDLPEGDEVSPIPFLTLVFIMMFMGLIQIVFQVRIAVHAFKESMGKGFCVLLVPFYVFIYGFTHIETKPDAKSLLSISFIAIFVNTGGIALLRSLGLM